MSENEKNVFDQMAAASELLTEPQRQRLLGIAEGVAIAVAASAEK